MMTFSDMWMKLIWEMKVNRNNKNDHRYVMMVVFVY